MITSELHDKGRGRNTRPKIEDLELISEALKRIRDITRFEDAYSKESPHGHIVLIPHNATYDKIVVNQHGFRLQSTCEEVNTYEAPTLREQLDTRIALGDDFLLDVIHQALHKAKKELCTFLHDAGVDTKTLREELNAE